MRSLLELLRQWRGLDGGGWQWGWRKADDVFRRN